MIKGIFHAGSGLGNQLHRYVGTKVIALEKGEEHTMIAPELFKGKDFMSLPVTPNDIKYEIKMPSGEVVPESYEGVVDREFQGIQDFGAELDRISEWLKVEPLELPDDLCVIAFRGGEYVGVPELFLPQEYWDKAIRIVRNANFDQIKFHVVTDDVETAKKFFPNFPISHEISMDWRMIRYAKNLILSNSSFSIFPALLGNAEMIIAPKYWARYNTKEWINLDNATYKKFTYIHHHED